MSANNEVYKEKAIEACKEIFFNEYNRSIGIPLPEIDFILPDSINFQSGEYFIKIGDTWQIHLNFGSLPVSYKDFKEEVKVLTRHEVEHYMCCPYNVITHFRMLNTIIKIYNSNYLHHKINIVSLAGNLANQIADIIIDTKNFYLHREETLKSEISWVKKGIKEKFTELPRHSKLMFLTKEVLWKENLELYEDDHELRVCVMNLASEFEMGGIDNKDLFLDKTVSYTHTFLKLYTQDKQDSEDQCKNPMEPNNNSPSDKQDGQPFFTPSKDANQDGSPFIFQSPDKIKEALTEFATETSIEEFSQVISSAGITSLTENEKIKIWFEAQNQDSIPISEDVPLGSNDNYSYPVTWRIGDPIEEIDLMLSFATSPVILPGITTKKWVKSPIFNYGVDKKESDLLLVIDTSGSMGSIMKPQNNIHQAVLASFGIIKYFETKSNQVAFIGFSDKITSFVNWTKDYDLIRNELIVNGSGGTKFPIDYIQSLIKKSKNHIVSVIITDGKIDNMQQTIAYFTDYLIDENKLFLFLQDKSSLISDYKVLKDYGGKVAKTLTAEQMRNSVLNELN